MSWGRINEVLYLDSREEKYIILFFVPGVYPVCHQTCELYDARVLRLQYIEMLLPYTVYKLVL